MIKLGIMGSGRIAKRFVNDVRSRTDVIVVSVYNPHIESASRFASENGIEHYTGNEEEFFDRVSAVYIATPHGTHYAYAKKALSRGLNVLCEKPMALDPGQVRELFDLASSEGVVLMEALKTAYLPGFIKLAELVSEGAVGKVCDVEAAFSRLTPAGSREFRDTECGGSFTEFGSYTLLPVIRFLGTDLEDITFQCLFDENGIDVYTKASFTYKEAMGLSKTGLSAKTEGQLVVAGTEGYILAPSPWWLTRYFEVRYEDPDKKDVYSFPFEGSGLIYEINAFFDAVQKKAPAEDIFVREAIARSDVMKRFFDHKGQKLSR